MYVVQAINGGGPDYAEVFYGPFTSAREVDSVCGRSGWFPPGGATDDELLAAARKRRVPITRFTRKRKPSVSITGGGLPVVLLHAEDIPVVDLASHCRSRGKADGLKESVRQVNRQLPFEVPVGNSF